MKKALPKMLSELIEELKDVLDTAGDMPVAVIDLDGRFYTSDVYLYPQEYYYDGGYIFPVAEEKRKYAYNDYETSRGKDADINPKLEHDMVLKIMGNGPYEEEYDTLDGEPYKYDHDD